MECGGSFVLQCFVVDLGIDRRKVGRLGGGKFSMTGLFLLLIFSFKLYLELSYQLLIVQGLGLSLFWFLYHVSGSSQQDLSISYIQRCTFPKNCMLNNTSEEFSILMCHSIFDWFVQESLRFPRLKTPGNSSHRYCISEFTLEL